MVRLVLHEKGLPWESKILDLLRGDQFQPEYRKINPKAVVPTLVHDAHTITELRLIIEYIEEAFPSPALMPADPYRKAVARLWMKKIDDYLHDAVAVLSFAIAFRRKLLKKTPEQIEARFAAASRTRSCASTSERPRWKGLRLPTSHTASAKLRQIHWRDGGDARALFLSRRR